MDWTPLTSSLLFFFPHSTEPALLSPPLSLSKSQQWNMEHNANQASAYLHLHLFLSFTDISTHQTENTICRKLRKGKLYLSSVWFQTAPPNSLFYSFNVSYASISSQMGQSADMKVELSFFLFSSFIISYAVRDFTWQIYHHHHHYHHYLNLVLLCMHLDTRYLSLCIESIHPFLLAAA